MSVADPHSESRAEPTKLLSIGPPVYKTTGKTPQGRRARDVSEALGRAGRSSLLEEEGLKNGPWRRGSGGLHVFQVVAIGFCTLL